MREGPYLPSAAFGAVSFGAGTVALVVRSSTLGVIALLSASLALVGLALLWISDRRASRRARIAGAAPQSVSVRPPAPAVSAMRREAPLPAEETLSAPRATPAGVIPPAPAAVASAPATPPVPDAPSVASEKPPVPVRPETSSPLERLRFPATMDSDGVMRAFLEAGRMAGDAVAAHLWLDDPGTSSLRMIAAVGEAPSGEPLPGDDVPLGRAVKTGRADIDAVPAPGYGEGAAWWRYAVPLGTNGARGVAGLDYRGERPDMQVLSEISPPMRGALAGALALTVAKRQLHAAETLLDTAGALSRLLRPIDVIEAALDRALSLSDAATGSIMLLDDDGLMRIKAARGLPADVVAETTVSEGEGIAGWVFTTRQPLLVEDLPSNRAAARRHGVRSSVSVPIANEDGVLGVLNVGSRRFPAWFTASHLTALETLGRQVAVALRNASAAQAAADVYFDTLRAFALAVETKDPYASGGTDRVLALARRIAEAMAVPAEEARAIEIAALLHDIGMTAAGDTVSVGDRPLSTVEKGILKMHPIIAAEVLEQAPALRRVVPIVYHHHEWYDGHGYVAGIAGEAIPLGARILAVADAYVAMTSDRPYRKALTHDEALHELDAGAGSQFDPAVVMWAEEVLGEAAERAEKMPSRA